MRKKRLLVSWIGLADIRAMGRSLPPDKQQELLKVVRVIANASDTEGPVKALLNRESFDKVHLISDFETWINEDYKQWVGCNPTIHAVNLSNPTDYRDVFVAADGVMESIVEKQGKKELDLAILLSPGTPAMAAIWVLLGKSKYPAKFYQTYNDKAWETEIPFDLAFDFVPELLRDSDRTLQHLAALSPSEVEGFHKIVGDSAALRIAVGRACKAAIRDVPVLLLGESGTGKEKFAEAIHSASHRRTGPFKSVNCAAIPESLLESELFGHVAHAFTNAIARKGALLLADGGTLFLDEIGDCSPSLQAKLLRVLQSSSDHDPNLRTFTPVGGSDPVQSNVRIITATNKDLLKMVESGELREDLFYRLAVVTIPLPPLRDRKSDVPALAQHFLDTVNSLFAHSEPGYAHKTLSDSARRFLREYSWPGNVRQLHNVILQAAVMASGNSLTRADLEACVARVPRTSGRDGFMERPLGGGFCIRRLIDEVQAHYLRRAMKEAGGKQSKAAELLGMKGHQTLSAQLKRLKVEWESHSS